MLFHMIYCYCIASGAQRLIGPCGNTYLTDQRSRVLTIELCGTSYLAYGHLGFWGAVLLCSTDSREVQQLYYSTYLKYSPRFLTPFAFRFDWRFSFQYLSCDCVLPFVLPLSCKGCNCHLPCVSCWWLHDGDSPCFSGL